MEQLVALSKQLGTPGFDKLYKAGRKRNIRVSKEDVKQFLATKGQKQIFRPYPPSKGKTGSESLDFRFMIDLIDLKDSPSRG